MFVKTQNGKLVNLDKVEVIDVIQPEDFKKMPGGDLKRYFSVIAFINTNKITLGDFWTKEEASCEIENIATAIRSDRHIYMISQN